MARSIPTINLNDYTSGSPDKRKALVKTLGDGLCEFGFLTIENHGVDLNLIKQTYDAFVKFFALPEATKLKYVKGEGGARGYTPFGKEHAKDSKYPDLKEFWHVGQELPPNHELRKHPAYIDNVWVDELPGMKDTLLLVYRALERCAEAVLEALADYFELPTRTFADMMKHGNSILRAIHYPPVPKGQYANSVRAAAHEDINLITLLVEATEPGLEILTRENTWLPISALSGQIVVDSGDMLARCTNNVVPATTHRVINPDPTSNRSRYSLPFFVHPYPTCDLTVKPRFVTKDNPPKWPPITADEFLQQRLKEIGLKK